MAILSENVVKTFVDSYMAIIVSRTMGFLHKEREKKNIHSVSGAYILASLSYIKRQESFLLILGLSAVSLTTVIPG